MQRRSVLRANVLTEGRGPAKVYVCESKIWSGAKRASAGIDQLMRYVDHRSGSANLIQFITGRDLERSDFKGVVGEFVEDWPPSN